MSFEFKKIAVVGSGTMGSGIAMVLAQAGINVSLHDVSEEYLEKGKEQIDKFLKGSMKRGKITEEEANQIKSRISFNVDLASSTKDVQLVNVHLLLSAYNSLVHEYFHVHTLVAPLHYILITLS